MSYLESLCSIPIEVSGELNQKLAAQTVEVSGSLYIREFSILGFMPR